MEPPIALDSFVERYRSEVGVGESPRKIRELLSDPSRWVQGSLAVDSAHTPVHWSSKDAVAWCLFGAYLRCYGYNDVIFKTLAAACGCKSLRRVCIEAWNDHPARTFADIRRLTETLNI
jgi:hypothetical protein